jgi:transcriptional regulator with XRE-family HTH domain
MSVMTDRTTDDLPTRIAQRVRELRAAQGLSLDHLAAHSGVSRSMISQIERGQSSPTAVVLERLATGLGVALVSLFEAPKLEHAGAPQPVARAADQVPWRDPQSGYVRRNVSPSGFASPIQIVEVVFPPRASVTYETTVRVPRVHQQVWVLEGRMHVSVGDMLHKLDAGDCLAMVLDQVTRFHNPTRHAARYAVVVTTEALSRH